jgi:hypothetical protein
LLPIKSIIGGEKSRSFEYSFNTNEKEKFVTPTFTSIPEETVNIPYLNAKDFCMHKIYNDSPESNDKEVKINISKKKWEKNFFNTFQKK